MFMISDLGTPKANSLNKETENLNSEGPLFTQRPLNPSNDSNLKVKLPSQDSLVTSYITSHGSSSSWSGSFLPLNSNSIKYKIRQFLSNMVTQI